MKGMWKRFQIGSCELISQSGYSCQVVHVSQAESTCHKQTFHKYTVYTSNPRRTGSQTIFLYRSTGYSPSVVGPVISSPCLKVASKQLKGQVGVATLHWYEGTV